MSLGLGLRLDLRLCEPPLSWLLHAAKSISDAWLLVGVGDREAAAASKGFGLTGDREPTPVATDLGAAGSWRGASEDDLEDRRGLPASRGFGREGDATVTLLLDLLAVSLPGEVVLSWLAAAPLGLAGFTAGTLASSSESDAHGSHGAAGADVAGALFLLSSCLEEVACVLELLAESLLAR